MKVGVIENPQISTKRMQTTVLSGTGQALTFLLQAFAELTSTLLERAGLAGATILLQSSLESVLH